MMHQHVGLENGRAKKAQLYPREFCKAICIGVQNQVKADKAGQFLFMKSGNKGTRSKGFMNASARWKVSIEQLKSHRIQVWK